MTDPLVTRSVPGGAESLQRLIILEDRVRRLERKAEEWFRMTGDGEAPNDAEDEDQEEFPF